MTPEFGALAVITSRTAFGEERAVITSVAITIAGVGRVGEGVGLSTHTMNGYGK